MGKTYHMEVNQDKICPQCGKGGAVKIQDSDDYGICLECATKNIKGVGMQKTQTQVLDEIEVLVKNYWQEIKTAYEKGAGMGFTIKVGLEPQGQQVGVTPTIEFYPLPKTKSEKFTALVDEKQLQIAGM